MDIQSVIYLYFDAQQRLCKNRITAIQNRVQISGSDFSYSDMCELMQQQIRLELLQKVELDINAILFYD